MLPRARLPSGAAALAPAGAQAARAERPRARRRSTARPVGAHRSAPRRAPGRCPRRRRADRHAARSPRCCSSGQISEAVYRKDYAIYTAAKRSLGQLSGTRRAELGAVLANIQAIAAAGQLSASRQAAVFLTLERNRHWWTTEPLLSSGERVSFPP